MDGLSSRLLVEIAEIVSESASPAAAWLPIMASLERALGFDSGFIAMTPGPTHSSQGAILWHDEALLRKSIGPYLRTITAPEIAQYLNRSRRDTDVWTSHRRKQLAAHYSPLAPRLAKHMLVRVSMRDGKLLGINLERTSKPFDERELALVDAAAPLIQLVDLLAGSTGAEPDLMGLWGLTPREAEVASFILRGLQNSEVAGILGLSVYTVRNTLARVFEKARVTTRAELVFVAHQLPAATSAGGPNASAPDGVLEFARAVRQVAGGGRHDPVPGVRESRAGLVYSAPQGALVWP